MIEKVRRTMQKYNMTAPDSTVLCALSGGADSVALLLALKSLSQEEGFSLFAVHINHNLRGEESDGDQRFCENLCKAKKIPLKVVSVNVTEYAKLHSKSIEEAARILRYQAFAEICNSTSHQSTHDANDLAHQPTHDANDVVYQPTHDANDVVYQPTHDANDVVVSTAHTLSDSTETILLNMTRGTGLKGLCGIPPVRKDGENKIIRPLIEVTRAEVEDFLANLGQEYVTDSTNLSDDYTRNKIRLKITPVLREINPNFEQNILKMIDNLRLDEEYISKSENYNISSNTLINAGNMEEPLRCRAISKLMVNNGVEPSYSQIKRVSAICENGGKICLSGDIYAVCEDGDLRIYTQHKGTVDFLAELHVGENPFLCGKTVVVEELSGDSLGSEALVNNMLTKTSIDYDKIQGKVVLRNRRSGDSIRLLGRAHTSKVKKLLNADIPLEKRSELVFIADDCGVIFVEGYGISERVSIDNRSKRIWNINIY